MAARRMAAPSSSSGSPLEVKLVLQARGGPTNVLQPRWGPMRGWGGADALLMTVLFHSPPQQNNGTCVTVAIALRYGMPKSSKSSLIIH